MIEENNNEQEKPVDFYHEKDFFGQEKLVDSHTELKVDNINTTIPYSEYQSVKHFCILCIFSFGLYQFFWFFKHWQYLKDEKKLDISPSFRTMFTLFFGYSLFGKFYTLSKEKGYKKRLPLLLIFIIYILMAILVLFKIGSFTLLSFFSFVPLIPILRMMNFYYIKEQSDYKIKTKLTKGEKLFLITIWGSLVFLAIVDFQTH